MTTALPQHLSYSVGDRVSFPRIVGSGADAAKVWIDGTVKRIHADVAACDQHPRVIAATVEGDDGRIYAAVNIAPIR